MRCKRGQPRAYMFSEHSRTTPTWSLSSMFVVIEKFVAKFHGGLREW